MHLFKLSNNLSCKVNNKAIMVFKRKIYQELLSWKKEYDTKYAILVEGARRIRKSTIVNEFAKNEFRTYISIDFLHVTFHTRGA